MGVYPSTFSSDGQVSLTAFSTLASGGESFFLNSEMCIKTVRRADVDFLGIRLIRLEANKCGQLSQGLIWKVRSSFLPRHLELGRYLFL